jgi:hypothetical protein
MEGAWWELVVMVTGDGGGGDGDVGERVDGGDYGAGGDSSGRSGIINHLKFFYVLRWPPKTSILYFVSIGDFRFVIEFST